MLNEFNGPEKVATISSANFKFGVSLAITLSKHVIVLNTVRNITNKVYPLYRTVKKSRIFGLQQDQPTQTAQQERPFWVICGHRLAPPQCPLCPHSCHSKRPSLMTALGHRLSNRLTIPEALRTPDSGHLNLTAKSFRNIPWHLPPGVLRMFNGTNRGHASWRQSENFADVGKLKYVAGGWRLEPSHLTPRPMRSAGRVT